MVFFHISDLHIGCRLYNRDLREDQTAVFEQLLSACEREKPDALVIAGDVYDKAIPSAEAVELFNWLMDSLASRLPGMPLLLISGNHDSPVRLSSYESILAREGVFVAGMPPMREGEHVRKVVLRDAHGEVVFWLLPFVKPSMARLLVAKEGEGPLSYEETFRRILSREEIDPGVRNVLVSHQFFLPPGKKAEEVERAESEVCTVGNIDQISAELLSPFVYAALGHIHKPMTVGEDRFRYCGTPLAMSVSEEGQEKGILRVELGEMGSPAKISRIPLTPLRQVRTIRGGEGEVLSQACEDYVRVVLTKTEGELGLYERLRLAFPCLLEVRREDSLALAYTAASGARREGADPLTLCEALLTDLDEESRQILRDVIECVQERGEKTEIKEG